MIYHKDERFMDIIKKSGTTDIFPAARYIMQLESIKEAASILVNKVNSVEFPFKYTGTDRPEDAVFGAEYLVRAIAEEQIQAEERFREMLVKVFKITRDMQEKEFGEYLDLDSFKDKRVRKELLIKSLPYVLAGWVGNKLSYIYRTSTVKDKAGRLLDMMDRLDGIVSFPPVSLYPGDILTGIAVGAGLRLAVYLKGRDAKKFRKGTEYGSAELGGPRDIEPFIDHNNPDNNLILTQTEQLSLAPRMPSPLHNRNKNVLVIGGSGTGKTRFYCKPNAMQLNCSYVFYRSKRGYR